MMEIKKFENLKKKKNGKIKRMKILNKIFCLWDCCPAFSKIQVFLIYLLFHTYYCSLMVRKLVNNNSL